MYMSQKEMQPPAVAPLKMGGRKHKVTKATWECFAY
jgi:hypothetical protein